MIGIFKAIIEDAIAGDFAAIWFCVSGVLLGLMVLGYGLYALWRTLAL